MNVGVTLLELAAVVSTTVTVVLGIIGFTTETKTKSGSITSWGKATIVLVILPTVISVAMRSVEDFRVQKLDDERSAQMNELLASSDAIIEDNTI